MTNHHVNHLYHDVKHYIVYCELPNYDSKYVVEMLYKLKRYFGDLVAHKDVKGLEDILKYYQEMKKDGNRTGNKAGNEFETKNRQL